MITGPASIAAIVLIFITAIFITVKITEKTVSKKQAADIDLLTKGQAALHTELSRERTSLQEKERELISHRGDLEICKRKISEKDSNLNALNIELAEVKSGLQKLEIDLETGNKRNELIARIINTQAQENEHYLKYKQLLENDYMEYANSNNSLEGEAAALLKLQEVGRQLQFITYDKSLLNKTVIAIAGSFSSGKSSFMNSFFESKKIKLPIGMEQKTAISSYVLSDIETAIFCCSWKGGKTDIPDDMFDLFSYDKMDKFNVNMKEIVSHFVFRNRFCTDFKNLCFIDTPGFNPGSETSGDHEAAILAIANAACLIWCFDVSAGTLKSDELNILYDIFNLNNNIKLYIIANKADLKSMEENIEIIDEVENLLNDWGINFEGISPYSSNSRYTEQDKDFSSCIKRKTLQQFLAENDVKNTAKKNTLIAEVENVFNDYIHADEERIHRYKKQWKTLVALENSFNKITDEKDDNIAYYKARIDRKFRSHPQKHINTDSTDIEAEFSNTITEIKNDCSAIMRKDKDDIQNAQTLSFKMSKCIKDIFGTENVKKTSS